MQTNAPHTLIQPFYQNTHVNKCTRTPMKFYNPDNLKSETPLKTPQNHMQPHKVTPLNSLRDT